MKICPQCNGTYTDDLTRCPQDGTGLLDLSAEQGAFVHDRDVMQRLQMVEAPHGKYTVIEKIGQGGWGGVYKAFQHSTKRVIALKVLRKDVAEDPTARRRFHQEAEAVSRLKHPNTVTMFDFGETPDGVLFMAMEYVEGQNLSFQISPDAPLKTLRAVRISRQVALSLAEAHDQGIIHRDIKPLNIMLTELGEQKDFVKVLDFGVAKLLSSDATLTSTGSTFGTPEYMSPEQVQSLDIDHRSDLYSLGIVMYEMLAGKPPFTGKSAVTVALAHARKKPAPINTHVDVYRPLAALVRDLLSKDPADRPQSAMEVAEELARIEAELSLDRPRDDRAGQFVRSLGRVVVGNWSAVITVLAVVLLVVGGLLGVKKWLVKNPDATQQASAVEAATAEPPDMVRPGAGRAPDVTAQPGIPAVDVTAEELGAPREELPFDVVGAGDTVAEQEVVSAAAAPDLVPEPVDVTADAGGTTAAGDLSVLPEVVSDSAVPGEVTVTITANVKGVGVYRGGRRLCTTPCPVRGLAGTSKSVTLQKNGFLPMKKRIHFAGHGELLVEMKPASMSSSDKLKGDGRPSDEDGLK